MPATSMTSVTTPASLFAAGLPTWELSALPLASALALLATAVSLPGAIRSCLLTYSEDGSRRIGVACFERAIMKYATVANTMRT